MAKGEFSVCLFHESGRHEYVRHLVDAVEAMTAAEHYCRSVGAIIGMTIRVIVTDGCDCVCWEWKHGEGVTFPKESPDVH